MAIVIKEDFQLSKSFFQTRRAFNGALGLPFAVGVDEGEEEEGEIKEQQATRNPRKSVK